MAIITKTLLGTSMTADRMFNFLEYFVKTKNDKCIIYERILTDYGLIDKDDENYDTWEKCSYIHYISFDLVRCMVHTYSRDYDGFCSNPLDINPFELKAIIQQCKELGWLDE